MRKWKVFVKGKPQDYVIVYAHSRDAAKAIGFKVLGLSGKEYLDVRAHSMNEDDKEESKGGDEEDIQVSFRHLCFVCANKFKCPIRKDLLEIMERLENTANDLSISIIKERNLGVSIKFGATVDKCVFFVPLKGWEFIEHYNEELIDNYIKVLEEKNEKEKNNEDLSNERS